MKTLDDEQMMDTEFEGGWSFSNRACFFTAFQLALRSSRAASAATCTRMYIVLSDGRARQWIKGFANTLQFSPAARSSPLFNLSSPNTESLNQGAAVFSARLMYNKKSWWSAKLQGTGAHIASRRYQVIACTIG